MESLELASASSRTNMRILHRCGGVFGFLFLLAAGCGGDATEPEPARTVETVTVAPGEITLRDVGAVAQLQATARDADGRTIDGRSFVWASSDASVALVDQSGLVEAIASGATFVSAATGGVEGNSQVTVDLPTTGALRIVTSTLGRNLDPDGYVAIVDDGLTRSIGIDDSVTIELLEPADYLVELDGLAPNCFPFSAEPAAVSVIRGSVSRILIEVECLGIPESIRFAFVRSLYNEGAMDIVGTTEPGGEVVPLTFHSSSEREPAWSADGRRLAFRRDNHIYMMNADGTGLMQLALGQNPAWSPDGSLLAFDTGVASFVIDPDDPGEITYVTAGVEPAWSPDGSQLAVEVDVPLGESDIFVVDLAAPDPVNLTSEPTLLDREPAWSPDGSRIVFRRLNRTESVGYDLWVMNSDGSDPERVISLPGPQTEPSWISNDQIVFDSDAILVIDLGAGGTLDTLAVGVSGESGVFGPAWRPDPQ
jgi:hypothetical protein